MKERILSLLKDLTAIDSISASTRENRAAVFLRRTLEAIPYFKLHPELTEARPIAGDPLGRDIVYGLVRGKGAAQSAATGATLILMGHYDVVEVEDYGRIRDYAFDITALPAQMADMDIDEETRRDLESGEWIFGRGAADMKGGLVAGLDYLEEYSQNPGGGNLLFLAVPDEESYSLGMRRAVEILVELRERWGLEYELLVNMEPTHREGGRQLVPIGTGGKCLPVALVQGKKAHAGAVFDGLNPVAVLGNIFSATDLCLDFVDTQGDEATMPPSWTYFKDMKDTYDVSLPVWAAGYFNVLSFYTTPEEVLGRLKTIARQAFDDYLDKIQGALTKYQALRSREPRTISREYQILDFGELMAYCRKLRGAEFETFYQNQYQEIKDRIQKNELNYPAATIQIMRGVLEFSGLTCPAAILGFAPPYYPAMCSTGIPGKEGRILEYFEVLRQFSTAQYGIDLQPVHYAVGLSDCSYAAIDKPFNYRQFADNAPLWGDLYHIDFDRIEKINVPCIILGPYSKDYHRMTERVFTEDLTVRIPAMLRHLGAFVFARSGK
jgi:arginine utilization protein RocB